ncbi:MAG: orotate phosphoribosyltransferase [Chloroflexi bacterium]|jgi:orotate phosphoribosyltransferase|nr:MAG: orotate phosphoribosyltransferase [Chloroflexota bacterium]
MDITAARDELRSLLRERSVRHGTFKLSSGAMSDFYVDCRQVTMDPRGMHLIAALMLDLTADLTGARAVGGLTMGADPIAGAIAYASATTDRPLAMFSVRKEPKGHGAGRQVEGPFPAEDGAPVIVVEDTMTTGASTRRAIEAIERDTKATVTRVLVIVDRLEGGADGLRADGYDVHALFTRRDFD